MYVYIVCRSVLYECACAKHTRITRKSEAQKSRRVHIHVQEWLHCWHALFIQVVKLQAGIKYAEEDLPNAKVHSASTPTQIKW